MNKRQINHLMSIGRKAVLALWDLEEYNYCLKSYDCENESIWFDMEFENEYPSNHTSYIQYTFSFRAENDKITYLKTIDVVSNYQ